MTLSDLARVFTRRESNKSKGTVAVVGLGYVGLPLAVLADRKGYTVIGVDRDLEKVEAVNKRIPPFEDERLSHSLPRVSSTFLATTDAKRVADADTIIVCVPTPVDHSHMPDLRPLVGACEAIAPHMKKGALLVIESTINPGVCESSVIPVIEAKAGLKAGKDYLLAHCPERINPGDPNWSVENIPRVVGGFDSASLQKAAALYESLVDAPIKRMGSLKEAEAVKVVENSFRDINIAFVNELAMSFDRLGIDVVNVIEGASTKPFAFMAHFPGCGVGGHCIPVDPYYLIEYGRQHGFNHDFLSLARKINNRMPEFTVELLEGALAQKGKTVRGGKIAVLGVSYKADIDDCRESPAFDIIQIIKDRGGTAVVFDPHVLRESTVTSIEEALTGADAVVVATHHSQFKVLRPNDFLTKGVEVVIDGRNCLNRDEFLNSDLVYRGIGRRSGTPDVQYGSIPTGTLVASAEVRN